MNVKYSLSCKIIFFVVQNPEKKCILSAKRPIQRKHLIQKSQYTVGYTFSQRGQGVKLFIFFFLNYIYIFSLFLYIKHIHRFDMFCKNPKKNIV